MTIMNLERTVQPVPYAGGAVGEVQVGGDSGRATHRDVRNSGGAELTPECDVVASRSRA